MEQKNYPAIVDALMALRPGSFLSPGTHLRLAYAYEPLGHAEEATAETAICDRASTLRLKTMGVSYLRRGEFGFGVVANRSLSFERSRRVIARH